MTLCRSLARSRYVYANVLNDEEPASHLEPDVTRDDDNDSNCAPSNASEERISTRLQPAQRAELQLEAQDLNITMTGWDSPTSGRLRPRVPRRPANSNTLNLVDRAEVGSEEHTGRFVRSGGLVRSGASVAELHLCSVPMVC